MKPALRFLTLPSMALAALLAAGPSLHAQSAKKPNPASKVYFSDVEGDALIDTGDKIEELSERSVYSAQGTVIETKPAATPEERNRNFSTMVYSNGTGAFFDSDTRVEVRRFVQEPFVPTRTDVDVEPSISQTHAFVSRGTVGLCTSKLVAGSIMTYQTPHGSVNIRGKRIVIEATPEGTRIAMLEGDSTVRAGPNDMGGHTLHAGQQAIIRPGEPGQPNRIEITRIPPQEASIFEEKVAIACAAKRTVYFEVRDRQNQGDADDPASSSSAVTAFDGDNAAPPAPPDREIVPVPVVPVELPVEYTVSPHTIGPVNPKG